jgi:hypothetical protein
VKFTIKQPNLDKIFGGVIKSSEHAVQAGMREATIGLKDALRADVIAGGLGDRFAKTWRGKTFPETGESLGAASYVWSRAPKLIDAFDRGVTIRSAAGFFLAIPTAAAGGQGRSLGGRRERITPGGWERRTGIKLRFVYRPRGPSLLVADQSRISSKGLAARNRRKTGDATVVVFILVPQVRLKKRLDIEPIAREFAAKVPGLIAKHWKLS